ncbi:MAG: peroxiredoxin [Hyphomicrobium sp.]
MPQKNLLTVDWSALPVPEDDGAARHLMGHALPAITLPATDGSFVDIASLSGRTVIYIYPLTGQPGNALPDDWDNIPGARGCTPQSCAFRDHNSALRAAGVDRVFGLSTQNTAYQREAADRLHLPFALLSDSEFKLADAMALPLFEAGGARLLKRMALVIDDARITQVFYPVFPPDRNAEDVLSWIRNNPS